MRAFGPILRFCPLGPSPEPKRLSLYCVFVPWARLPKKRKDLIQNYYFEFLLISYLCKLRKGAAPCVQTGVQIVLKLIPGSHLCQFLC